MPPQYFKKYIYLFLGQVSSNIVKKELKEMAFFNVT